MFLGNGEVSGSCGVFADESVQRVTLVTAAVFDSEGIDQSNT